MSNKCLSVLYKHIIQVENKNGGGGAQKYHCPFNQKNVGGGAHAPLPPPPPAPASYARVKYAHYIFLLLTTYQRETQHC